MRRKQNHPTKPPSVPDSDAFLDQAMDLVQNYMSLFNTTLDRLYRLIFKADPDQQQELIDILTRELTTIAKKLTIIVRDVEKIARSNR